MTIVYFILIVLLITNFLTLHAMSEKLEQIEQTLVDMDIIYMKMQQFFRNQ